METTSNTILVYSRVPPCIEASGHAYGYSSGVVVCLRCGDVRSGVLPPPVYAPQVPVYGPYWRPYGPGSPIYVGDVPGSGYQVTSEQDTYFGPGGYGTQAFQ